MQCLKLFVLAGIIVSGNCVLRAADSSQIELQQRLLRIFKANQGASVQEIGPHYFSARGGVPVVANLAKLPAFAIASLEESVGRASNLEELKKVERKFHSIFDVLVKLQEGQEIMVVVSNGERVPLTQELFESTLIPLVLERDFVFNL